MASGRYDSPRKVVEEALNLLEMTDRMYDARADAINAGIDRGRADIRAGRTSPFDQAAVERIKRRGREMLAKSRRKSA